MTLDGATNEHDYGGFRAEHPLESYLAGQYSVDNLLLKQEYAHECSGDDRFCNKQGDVEWVQNFLKETEDGRYVDMGDRITGHCLSLPMAIAASGHTNVWEVSTE